MVFFRLVALTLALGAGLASPALALQRAVPPKSVQARLEAAATSGRIVIKFTESSALEVDERGVLRSAAFDRGSGGDPGAQGTVGYRAGGSEEALARIERLLRRETPGATLSPRFSTIPVADLDALRARARARTGRTLPDLTRYAVLEGAAYAGDREALLRAVRALRRDPAVEAAWLEPVAVPAALGFEATEGKAAAGFGPAQPEPGDGGMLTRVSTPRAMPALPTGDFTSLQTYLGPAPTGIDVLAMAAQPGSDGASVKVLDVEGGWLWTHEDLPAPFAQIGPSVNDLSWRNHGTAVMGLIAGLDDTKGIRGITPGAQVGHSSIAGQSVAEAVTAAAAALAPGDIILIELHAPGPNADGNGQFGYVPMELWQDNFDAILLASAAGIIVVEAGGNGSQDLDAAVYDGLFDRNVRDSGAILVGATQGASLAPAWFSNYGSRVDLHGWGADVVTLAYGTLQGEPLYPEPQWYSNTFSGTSSASPMVVGAVASLQGMVDSAFGIPMDARLARDILVATGTAQSGTAHIGPRPNLPAAWALASGGIGEVAGTVTELGSGSPLEGIEVEIISSGSFAHSGATGAYRLPLLAGSDSLRFTSFFHETVTRGVTVSAGVSGTENVALPLLPTVTVETWVADEGAQPLAGARVAPRDVPIPGAVTDAAGYAGIPGVPVDRSYGLLIDGVSGHGAAFRALDTTGLSGSVALYEVLPTADETFEVDAGGFTADSLWSWGVPQGDYPLGGFSGSRVWGVGLDGGYPDDATATLTSPSYDFSGGSLTSLRLSFHYWCETENEFDGVNLEVWTGSGWEPRAPLEGYPDIALGGLGFQSGWSGSTGEWRGTVFEMSDLLGPDVRFRLVFGSDKLVFAAGFWIDDVTWSTGVATTGVPGDGGEVRPVAPLALTVAPNPTPAGTVLSWSLSDPGPLTVEIFDLRGRRVRTLWDGAVAERAGEVRWDGRDEAGRPAAAGVYFARVRSLEAAASRRVVLTR